MNANAFRLTYDDHFTENRKISVHYVVPLAAG